MSRHPRSLPTTLNDSLLGPIKRETGVAGQVAYTVTITEDGERSRVTFVGTVYGTPGPVVMVSHGDGLGQTFVRNPERFGAKFNPAWVRAFFDFTP